MLIFVLVSNWVITDNLLGYIKILVT